MIKIIKEYFHRADDLPKKERIIEKTLIFLELFLLLFFTLEIIGIIPFNIGNYIIVPGLVIYILLNVIKNFKKSVMLSIMMLVSLGIILYFVFRGGF